MLGADVCQLHIADCLIDAAHQLSVSVKGLGLCSAALLQIQHIDSVVCESLAVVQHKALFNTPLKVRSGPLDGLFNLPGCHAGIWLVGLSVSYALALGVKARIDGDPVGGAGFASEFFNRCHWLLPH